MKLRVSDIKKVYYKIQKGLSEYQANIHCLCNKYVNIASPDQVNYVLVKELNLFTKPPKTLELQSNKDKHPIIPLILEYRSLYSLSSQWIDFLHNYSNNNNKENKSEENEDGDFVILHPLFRHFTATGRLYSCNPNIQAAPHIIQYINHENLSIYDEILSPSQSKSNCYNNISVIIISPNDSTGDDVYKL